MILLASEHTCGFYNGKYYLVYRAFSIYERYAKKFGNMILCSRVEELKTIPEDYYEAQFVKEVIWINNLQDVLLRKYDKRIEEAVGKCNLVVARIPSIIAYKAADVARKCRVAYIAESMCDAWDSYWNHGLVGKAIAPYMFFKMKDVAKHGDYAIYVTQQFLQKRYPCPNKSIGVSNVVIKSVDENVLGARLKKINGMDKKNIKIMTTAGVDLHSKGQEYVVTAMGDLKRKGINVVYYLAGDGDENYLRGFARKCGVEDNLVFLGRIPLCDVFHYIDDADIYIQPSLQEGLPRAVIEAMSRSCPCLGARTAGIPELLDDECVFARKSAGAIVKSIEMMLTSNMCGYAMRNYEKAQGFLEQRLNDRRNKYFDEILENI